MERGPLSLLVTTAASFANAAISFYFVEKPFVALRKRFGAHIVKREETGVDVAEVEVSQAVAESGKFV